MQSLRKQYPYVFRASILIFSFAILFSFLLLCVRAHETAFYIIYMAGWLCMIVCLCFWIWRWNQIPLATKQAQTQDAWHVSPPSDEEVAYTIDDANVPLDDDDEVV